MMGARAEADREHLFWWSPPGRRLPFATRENAGDYLSRVLVSRLLATHGLRLRDRRPAAGRLLAIGSILHFARDGDVIWGCGLNGKIPPERHAFRRLDVRAVRGPLTREFLRHRGIACPAVYGDPALLLPRFLPGLRPRPRRDCLVVRHLHDRGPSGVPRRRELRPTVPWRRFLRRILASRLVLSASLHGLVVAEAFGIPARLLRLGDGEPLLKYRDYYAGTGRHDFRYACSVEEGLALGGEPPPRVDTEALLAAFPLDLWMR